MRSGTENGPDGLKSDPRWTKMAHLGPLLHTLDAVLRAVEALLATWGIPLRIFMHFYEVFVSNCAFFLKIRGDPRKIKQIALKIMNIVQKHRKGH